MTVKELKEKLANIPGHTFVFIKQVNNEFSLSLVADAKVVVAEFMEDSGPAIGKDKVFLLTDDI
jgi:hypothetical protein